MRKLISDMTEVHRQLRGHRFFPTADELREIPAFYAQDNEEPENNTLYAHYFLDSSHWYVAELNPRSGEAFGWVCLNGDLRGAEWGYFDLATLEPLVSMRPGTLVKRDLEFAPTRAHEVLAAVRHKLNGSED
ncbi:hypothetical protein AB0K09_15745 [Streptomyces sp. NPDC049577]|uniref:hypothetical protein n=1 Tax=Streptomyces sp. NPDC049577 TaxID=3155153 RepID=UPI003433E5A1